jgi:predicted transport protein
MGKPEEQLAAMLANLPEKTGKSLEEWLKVVKATGLAKHGEIVKHLKSEHGVTHGYANQIANQALANTAVSADAGDLVEEQYAGAKAALRPIYETLMAELKGFGNDVDVAPKKAYVSVRRKKQFAIVQPSTATRVDLGINLKGVPPQGRLEASGSFNAMVSHRVKLASKQEVDAEVKGWLKRAYDEAS